MRATWTDQGPSKKPDRGETVVVEEELLRVTLPHDLPSSNLAETGKPFLPGAFSPTAPTASSSFPCFGRCAAIETRTDRRLRPLALLDPSARNPPPREQSPHLLALPRLVRLVLLLLLPCLPRHRRRLWSGRRSWTRRKRKWTSTRCPPG
jgi:hypothetical protein